MNDFMTDAWAFITTHVSMAIDWFAEQPESRQVAIGFTAVVVVNLLTIAIYRRLLQRYKERLHAAHLVQDRALTAALLTPTPPEEPKVDAQPEWLDTFFENDNKLREFTKDIIERLEATHKISVDTIQATQRGALEAIQKMALDNSQRTTTAITSAVETATEMSTKQFAGVLEKLVKQQEQANTVLLSAINNIVGANRDNHENTMDAMNHLTKSMQKVLQVPGTDEGDDDDDD